MHRRGCLTGIAAVLLTAACAGCASASTTSSPSVPVGTTAAASPSQHIITAPPSSSPSAQGTTAPRTYTFLDLTIGLQAGWQPGAVVREADGTLFNGVATSGSCQSSSTATDCPGFLALYEPSYRLGQTFTYASGQNGCPQDRGLMQVFPSGMQSHTTNVSIGGRSAYLTEVKVNCISNNPSGGSTTHYTQRLWWIPSAQILVVDDGWIIPGLASALRSATWTSNPAPGMDGYIGTWHRHTDEFVINSNGTGTEIEGDGSCPNDPTSMCGFIGILSYASTAQGLKATYASVLPTVNGTVDDSYKLDPAEPHVNDSFTLAIDPHHRLQVVQAGRLTQFDGSDRRWLCDANTPQQFNTCGA